MESGYELRSIFSPQLVNKISSAIRTSWSEFDSASFESFVVHRLDPLGLKERADLITSGIEKCLPDDYPTSVSIILNSFGPESEESEMSGMDVFYYMPFANYVAANGLEHFELSMEALQAITRRFTAEFPIRPFLQKYPEQTLNQLRDWASSPNVHDRRLVSEGTRPRLPWAPRLPEFQKDPSPVIELLELLKEDPELYVRRSVANNLNDIGKDHPDLVVNLLKKWNKSDDKGTKWIIRHASRSLIKAGHKEALELLGFKYNAHVKVEYLNIPDSVEFGSSFQFSFKLKSEENEKIELMVDYVIHHMKANGKTAPKVFKLGKKSINPGESIDFSKNHPIKPISTRKYYPGKHRIEIQVNGVVLDGKDFELSMS